MPAVTRHALLLCLGACSWFSEPPAPPEDTWCGKTHHLTCWLKVDGSTFTMGAQASDPAGAGYDPDAQPDEGPVRSITLPSFWILKHEVPADTFGKCIAAGGCREEQIKADDQLSTIRHEDKRFHPANTVSWEGARSFCTWYGGRLPTEAEWELAARGTDARRFPWGSEAACGTARSRTSGTWTKEMDPPPCRNRGTLVVSDMRGSSPAGLVGAAGNALEWVDDWYGPYDADAAGPATGTLKVLRGGSWVDEDPANLRATARHALPPEMRLHDVGFRCVYAP